MADTIKQTVTFDAPPAKIFEALMDTRKHKAFTGAPAKIARKAGGAFSAYGGMITGINLDVVRNKSIVQAWRAKDWPKDAWSIATYALASAKGGKTKLTFEQSGVPKGKQRAIAAGWSKFYWEPLKKSLQAAGAPAKPKPAGRKSAKAKPKAAGRKTAAAKRTAAPRKAAKRTAAPRKAAKRTAAPRKAGKRAAAKT